MKKKILNGFLVAVMLLAGMSTFVSCKDYDEDSYNELKKALNEEVNLRKNLEAKHDSLYNYAHNLTECKCDLKKELADYLKKADADATYMTKAEAEDLKNKIEANKASIDLLQKAIDEINKQIADINNKLGNVDTSIGTIAEQLNNLNVTILNVKAIAEEALELAKKGGSSVDLKPLENRIKALEDLVAGWDAKLKEVNDSALKALALYYSLQAQVDANRYIIDSLSVYIKSITPGGKPIDLSNYVTKDQLEAAKKEALNKAEEARKLAQEALVKALAAQIDADAAQASADAAQKTADEAKKAADEALKTANAYNTKIGDIEKQIKLLVEQYKTQIEELIKGVGKVKEDLGGLQDKVSKLQNDVLKKMITGVILQGTTNPMFGTINTPLDARSMMLATYWGEYANDVNFPYASDASSYYYTNEYNNLTASAILYLDQNVPVGSGRHLFGENDGKASLGTLYLTINPAEVDFAGGQPLQGFYTSGTETQAPVTIGALQHSNTDMSFGVTRGANNGFYETEVTLNVSDIDKARLNMDLKALGSDLKAVLKNRTKASVVQLGATFYNNIQNVLPAYGAKVAWTDESTSQTHSIYSQYNLGIMTLKPVSFNFADDISGVITSKGKLPGYDRLQNLAARLCKEVRTQIHKLYPNINSDAFKFEFKSISIGNGINPETGKGYDIDLDADGNINFKVTVVDEFNVTNTYTVKFPSTIDDKNWLTDFIKAINDRYGKDSDIDKAFGELVNTLNQVIQLEDDLTDMVTDYEKRIQNKITKVNNKLVDYIEYLDRALQLTMVGTTNNKSAMLSQSVYNPTRVTGSSMTLFPTSNSVELFAPAYKKFVAVTNVYDAATGTQASDYMNLGKSANGENMAKVFDGREKCTINGKAGYIYEITYAGLDFHGKISVKQFYVQFM